MGADIYLPSVNERHEREHRSLFDQMVLNRDHLITKLGGRDKVMRDPRLSKQVDKLQQYVGEAYEILTESPGYFRDSYNDTSLFWVLGISWWEIADKMLDEERNLPIEHAKELLAFMETERETFDETFAAWVEKKRKGKKEGVDGALYDEKPWKFDTEGGSVEDWRKMFRTKLDRFIELLKRSIEMNEPLHWSV